MPVTTRPETPGTRGPSIGAVVATPISVIPKRSSGATPAMRRHRSAVAGGNPAEPLVTSRSRSAPARHLACVLGSAASNAEASRAIVVGTPMNTPPETAPEGARAIASHTSTGSKRGKSSTVAPAASAVSSEVPSPWR